MAMHIQYMTGYYPNRWLRICWKYISPALIMAILVFSLIKYHPVEYKDEQYPIWADLIGWLMPISTILPILIVAVVVVYRSQGNTILARMRSACRPRLAGHGRPVVMEINVALSGSKQSLNNGNVIVANDVSNVKEQYRTAPDGTWRTSVRL